MNFLAPPEGHRETHTQQAAGPLCTCILRLEHRLCYSSCYLCARSRCAFCFVLGGAIYDSEGLEDGSMSLFVCIIPLDKLLQRFYDLKADKR